MTARIYGPFETTEWDRRRAALNLARRAAKARLQAPPRRLPSGPKFRPRPAE